MIRKSLLPLSAILMIQPAISKQDEKPNILFILTDNLVRINPTVIG